MSFGRITMYVVLRRWSIWPKLKTNLKQWIRLLQSDKDIHLVRVSYIHHRDQLKMEKEASSTVISETRVRQCVVQFLFCGWVGAGVASRVCCSTHSNWNNPTPQSSDETSWITGGAPDAPHMGPRRKILEGPCWGSSVSALSMYVRYFSAFAVCVGCVLHFGELATPTVHEWVLQWLACFLLLWGLGGWVQAC